MCTHFVGPSDSSNLRYIYYSEQFWRLLLCYFYVSAVLSCDEAPVGPSALAVLTAAC